MNELFTTAIEVQEFCDAQGWRSCFIGGLAVQYWGEPRVTRDVDVTLMTGFGNEEVFVEALLGRFGGRMEEAKDFALRHRVLLLRSDGGVAIAIYLGALPFEEGAVARAELRNFGPGLELRICSAEDLIVMKLFALRAIDIRDAESVVTRRGALLDWTYIETQLEPLAEVKQDARILETLVRLRAGL